MVEKGDIEVRGKDSETFPTSKDCKHYNSIIFNIEIGVMVTHTQIVISKGSNTLNSMDGRNNNNGILNI